MSYGWDRGPVGMSQKCQVRTLDIYSAEPSVGPLRRLKVAGGGDPRLLGLTVFQSTTVVKKCTFAKASPARSKIRQLQAA